MYFSDQAILKAFEGLVRLDDSLGKSRKEKVSGLRYLFAASRLLRSRDVSEIDLSVGQGSRDKFVRAVGEVVALNAVGLYTKDFKEEFAEEVDYKVRSNFFTTRLANSRSATIQYPGRPAPLLLLSREKVSLLPDLTSTLADSYGVGNIKAELSVWLLRAEDIDGFADTADEVRQKIEVKLSKRYTQDVVDAIQPSAKEVEHFLQQLDGDGLFQQNMANIADLNQASVEEGNFAQVGANVLENNISKNDTVFQAVQELMNRGSKGVLFVGPPGTSKTWYALKVAIKITEGDGSRLERVQFHPSFTYEDFIEGLVSTGSASGNKPMFQPKDKVFLKLCDKARADTDNLYLLVIDEFSRGDPSKIFGELLTYIEPDYRDIDFRLPYSEKETSIPQNVVIFATMNPYDKSVSDLDSAMERRFDVVELSPSIDILKLLLREGGIKGEKMGKIIQFFNEANRLSPHGFGHTYFKGITNDKDLWLLWNHKLKFIFNRMFRFEHDSYEKVRESFVSILGEDNKNKIE